METSRRNFLKSAFAAAAVAAIPSVSFGFDSEFDKCRSDIVYFANKYYFGGKSKLRKWEEDYLRHISAGNGAVLNAARCTGKTTLSQIYILWSVIFDGKRKFTFVSCGGESLWNIRMRTIADLNSLPKGMKTEEIVGRFFKNVDFQACSWHGRKNFGDVVILDECASYALEDWESISAVLNETDGDTSVIFASTPIKKYDIFGFIVAECEKTVDKDYFKATAETI